MLPGFAAERILSMKNRRRINGGGGAQGPSSKGYLLLLSFIISDVFFIAPSAACFNGNCQLLDSCASATDCGAGLYCGNCPVMGKNQPFCIRGQATVPTSIISGLPFNKYSWLVTHNAFSIVDADLRELLSIIKKTLLLTS
nr:PI-PLC X domain-containing protein At5g67130 [Ipomoea batatas]